jgi:hypothetical protein
MPPRDEKRSHRDSADTYRVSLTTTRKTIIRRNVFCGAPKNACSTKLFLWRIEKYAPQKFRHRILAFCGACGRMRHRISMGPTRGPVLHMGEGNSVAHVYNSVVHMPICATEIHHSVAHVGICTTESVGFFLLSTQLHLPPGSPF